MGKLVSITKAAEILGVSAKTIRRWESEGRGIECVRTVGGQRRYDISKLMPQSTNNTEKRITIGYARVSTPEQKSDLETQKQVLESYCRMHFGDFEIISDLGSGMNYHKRGLRLLLERLLNDEISRLVITNKDRLLRFGSELVFAICEIKGVEVVIINHAKAPSFEEELVQDVLEIITVFSARLHGSRSHKNKKLIDNIKKQLLD